jgi:threonine aldolase
LIDLRSDTVTLPTPEMREAIARAELGDDVYGEDPTVNRLETMAASIVGKDAALLVPSGTMGNLAAMLTHCARGTKAIVGSQSHTNLYEAGGASALGGIVLTAIANTEEGELDTHELARELGTPADDHFAQPSLVVIENTHNRCGGAPIKLSHMAEVSMAAHQRKRKIPLHLDGARIFNAALALETTPKEIASSADTVSFCLSKGLGCPVGSLLCGSREFIAGAHRTRKLLGGGMRQAGIIAAAGIVALTTMVDRLAEDHQNARALAQGLALVAGLNVRAVANRTNMVVFDVDGDADASRRFAVAMRERDVLISPRDSTSFRAVTHHGISRADIDRAVAAAAQATGEVFGD